MLAMAAVSSSSSVALRLRWLPHMSSRRFGGSALIGCNDSTLPSEGASQESGLDVKPCSSNCAALSARDAEDDAPRTTAIIRLLSRVAVATRLKPEAQMNPVFMPSAPG